MWNFKTKVDSRIQPVDGLHLKFGSVYKCNDGTIVTPIMGVGSFSIGLDGEKYDYVILVLDSNVVFDIGKAYNPSTCFRYTLISDKISVSID